MKIIIKSSSLNIIFYKYLKALFFSLQNEEHVLCTCTVHFLVLKEELCHRFNIFLCFFSIYLFSYGFQVQNRHKYDTFFLLIKSVAQTERPFSFIFSLLNFKNETNVFFFWIKSNQILFRSVRIHIFKISWNIWMWSWSLLVCVSLLSSNWNPSKRRRVKIWR